MKVMSLLGAFTQSRKVLISYAMSVCPHISVWLPLDGLPLNLIGVTS